MKYLIATEADDIHAIIVKLALEEKGHSVRLFFSADQPTKLKNSILIDNESYQWKSWDRYESHTDHEYDVVWWRRARKPYIPNDAVHPDDLQFVKRENNLFFESIANTIGSNAKWINKKYAASRANSKMYQLTVAKNCGLNIPETLCSNDPIEIRYFLLNYEQEGVIYKPMCTNFWFENERIKISYTNRVDFLELPSNKLLQNAPGIYQKEVKKNYELRVTYFGGFIVAVKLDSQIHDDGKVDWRAISSTKMQVELYFLPKNIEAKLIKFMKKMDLEFGCIDLIVNTEGEYIFLEVNEQGQFLWLEDLNPELKMLDIFIQFLETTSSLFSWQRKSTALTVDEYRSETLTLLNQNKIRHVDLNDRAIA